MLYIFLFLSFISPNLCTLNNVRIFHIYQTLYQNKLFGFFQQVDMSSTKKHEGTGLGLYISKMIVEDVMGGKLDVININTGVCFNISLSRNLK